MPLSAIEILGFVIYQIQIHLCALNGELPQTDLIYFQVSRNGSRTITTCGSLSFKLSTVISLQHKGSSELLFSIVAMRHPSAWSHLPLLQQVLLPSILCSCFTCQIMWKTHLMLRDRYSGGKNICSTGVETKPKPWFRASQAPLAWTLKILGFFLFFFQNWENILLCEVSYLTPCNNQTVETRIFCS